MVDKTKLIKLIQNRRGTINLILMTREWDLTVGTLHCLISGKQSNIKVATALKIAKGLNCKIEDFCS
jgi:DNA-binding Xre family transcriptional regulator